VYARGSERLRERAKREIIKAREGIGRAGTAYAGGERKKHRGKNAAIGGGGGDRTRRKRRRKRTLPETLANNCRDARCTVRRA